MNSVKPITVPRLQPGQALHALEPLGCINSGHSVAIRRPRARPEVYLVSDCDIAALEVAQRAAWVIPEGARKVTHKDCMSLSKRDTVYVFRSRAPAVRKFQALCMERATAQIAEIEKLRAAKRALSGNDLSAAITGALALSDAGAL